MECQHKVAIRLTTRKWELPRRRLLREEGEMQMMPVISIADC